MRKFWYENLNLKNIIFKEKNQLSVTFTFYLPNISLDENFVMRIYPHSINGSLFAPDRVDFDIYKSIFKEIEEKESKNYPDISFHCFEHEESRELKNIIRFFIINSYTNSSEYLLKTTFNEKNCLSKSYFKDLYESKL
jgi:hypothetical protein